MSPKPRALLASVVAAASWLCAPAFGQVAHRLDTAASPRQQVAALLVTDEKGQPLGPFAQQAHARFGRVEYRLSTGAFLNQRVRIDIVLPPIVNGLQRPSGLVFRWRGLDGSQDGQLMPGQRQPLWSGSIASAQTLLSIDLEMQLELGAMGRWNGGNFGVEPSFELVVLP